MNGWGFLFWLASVIAGISIPLVSFALLMRLVGRIATQTLIVIDRRYAIIRSHDLSFVRVWIP
jgi:hypothetical protein